MLKNDGEAFSEPGASEITLYTDGASSGNPGPAGVGFIICNGKTKITDESKYIGITTNNVAEYTAVILGLQKALSLQFKEIKIRSDSQLLVKQIQGSYKVKNQNLIVLNNICRYLIDLFKSVSIEYVPRDKNKDADSLAVKAIKVNRLL